MLEVVNEEPEMSKDSPEKNSSKAKPPIHPNSLLKTAITPSMVISEGSELHSLKTISSVKMSEIVPIQRKRDKKRENTKSKKSRNSTKVLAQSGSYKSQSKK